MIAITDIIDLLVEHRTVQVFPTFCCCGQCYGVLLKALSMFNGVCGPHLWILSQRPAIEAKVATTQDWLYTCLDRYGMHTSVEIRQSCCHAEYEHALHCSEQVTWTVVFACRPMFIVLQLFDDYTASTRVNLEVSIPVNSELMMYRLGCVVYYTGNHFISRILPLGSEIYEYDGQIFEGMLHPCRLENIQLGMMYTGHAHLALYFPGSY